MAASVKTRRDTWVDHKGRCQAQNLSLGFLTAREDRNIPSERR